MLLQNINCFIHERQFHHRCIIINSIIDHLGLTNIRFNFDRNFNNFTVLIILYRYISGDCSIRNDVIKRVAVP